ncbi:hypothetical protein [Myxococcus eversor]|uniref:hypothetical protein n=1 Tax=Myxococcus eversor TaxID=2709661 RepID=UPI0013D8A7D2|nr:hypothetical protein [Myxococcus eversor]
MATKKKSAPTKTVKKRGTSKKPALKKRALGKRTTGKSAEKVKVRTGGPKKKLPRRST